MLALSATQPPCPGSVFARQPGDPLCVEIEGKYYLQKVHPRSTQGRRGGLDWGLYWLKTSALVNGWHTSLCEYHCCMCHIDD
jgi:hypothetical protein